MIIVVVVINIIDKHKTHPSPANLTSAAITSPCVVLASGDLEDKMKETRAGSTMSEGTENDQRKNDF